MGVDLGEIIKEQKTSLNHLKGRKIAIDAYNTLYQFLSIIRQRDGSPLKDSRGRTTSHLSGLLYRTGKIIEKDIKPVYVFDGEPPTSKKETIEKRKKKRKKAQKKYKEALKKGEEKKAKKHAQATSKLNKEMVKSSKSLLEAMGIPYIQAPGEGEAQAAYLAKEKDVWASSSQDFDSLLYKTPILIRNLTITGKRKLPNKDKYIHITPEKINLKETLEKININHNQLIDIAILIGTDYNPGIKGIGPKTALKEIKKGKKPEQIYREKNTNPKMDLDQLREIFKKPKITNEYKIKWNKPNKNKMIQELVNKHDFSQKRVEKVADKITKKLDEGTQQSHLGEFK